MTRDPAQPLRDFNPSTPFFVGIDSDGCVFDSMEIKHKECFAPMFIKHFGLQAVSKYAREVWEFVNLYSKSRGINRYPAVSLALNLLRVRPEVMARGVSVLDTEAIDSWMDREARPGNDTLKAALDAGDEGLRPIYEWSIAVNDAIEDIVKGVPPFPGVRESLNRLKGKADMLVVSQTPAEALEREWSEHGIVDGVRVIAGQEMGTKTMHLKLAAAGRYPAERILMIGDAPGDQKAAKANGALFFPVNPGSEEASWQIFLGEGIDRFFAGTYAGEFEQKLADTFDVSLPKDSPWK
jgi:phosphoglycolate phosphatase-like HAD superfamily hydrolase